MTRSRGRSASERRKKKPKKRPGAEPTAEAGTTAPAAKTKVRRPFVPFLFALLLGSVAGVLYFVAFPGIDVWPLAFVALVPLFAGIDLLIEPRAGGISPYSTARAVTVGVVFGLVTNLGGYYWLVPFLEVFSGFPFVLCVLFAAVLCTYQGGLLAVFVWLYARARHRGWSALLVAPVAFGAAELVYPLLFESYYAAHFHDLPAMIQVVDLGGPILLTLIAVAVNAAIYEVGRALVRKERVPWKGPAMAAGALAATLIYGAVRVPMVDAAVAEAPKIAVGLVQVNMGIFAKREDPEEGRRRHVEQSMQLAREVPELDLLVWPESAFAWFVPEDDDGEAIRRYVMGPVRTPLLFGGLSRREVDGEERHYNTAFLVDADGRIQGSYDKTHLLAFGEHLPLGDVFPILYEWSPHSGRFTPGDHTRPVVLDGRWRITALICYEDILPRFTRNAVADGDPHLLVNMTNDAWFGDTTEPWQHLALAKLRAVEHHRYLVRSTNSGVSAIVDPVGRTLGEVGVYDRGNLHADVAMLDSWTLYQTLGNWPGWLSAAAILALAFWKRRPV